LACARFSPLPGILIAGEFPPGISGYNNDASSPFWQESTPFRLEFGEFSREFRAIHHGQPRPPLPSATAPFPARRPPFAPRLSRPPPAASRGPPAWPYDLAGALGGKAGAGRGGRWGAGRYIHGEGYHRENKYRSSFGWRADYDCFTSCARILVWEFTRRFIPGTACAFPGSGGYRCRQVDVKEYGIAGGKEHPPVRVRLSRGGVSAPARGLRRRARRRAGGVMRPAA
jgi:hypothetical protein